MLNFFYSLMLVLKQAQTVATGRVNSRGAIAFLFEEELKLTALLRFNFSFFRLGISNRQ